MRKSERKVERIINYRRVLSTLAQNGETNIFSHELAKKTNATPAQVRRDLMEMESSGSPAHGYEIDSLISDIEKYIGTEARQDIALVGVGNLGKAIINYVNGATDDLKISVAFDIAPEKTDRVVAGCHSYHIDKIEKITTELNINTAILTVPSRVAQEVAEQIVDAGITGILNYAPVNLNLPKNIFIENRDMISAAEKVSYFSGK